MNCAFGITGYMGSGKGTVIDILKEYGFTAYSLSNVVRAEAQKRGLPAERKTLQDVGNDLRQTHGPAVLALRTIEEIRAADPALVAIEGIRNPAEVTALVTNLGAVIVAVTVPDTIRIERIQRRKRPGDPETLEELHILEQRDRGVGEDAVGQQTEACIQMATVVITNDGDLNTLREQVKRILIDPFVLCDQKNGVILP